MRVVCYGGEFFRKSDNTYEKNKRGIIIMCMDVKNIS